MNIHNKKITACWKTVAEWDWKSPQRSILTWASWLCGKASKANGWSPPWCSQEHDFNRPYHHMWWWNTCCIWNGSQLNSATHTEDNKGNDTITEFLCTILQVRMNKGVQWQNTLVWYPFVAWEILQYKPCHIENEFWCLFLVLIFPYKRPRNTNSN